MLIKVKNQRNKIVYINPDHIILVEQSPLDPKEITIVMGPGLGVHITAEEFARLEPLLLNTPAPVAAVPAPSPVDPVDVDEAWWQNLFDLCSIWTHEPSLSQQEKAWEEIQEHIRTYAALPADVIAAYRDYVDVCAGKYTYATEKTALNRLGDTLKAYMPAAAHEESDNE